MGGLESAAGASYAEAVGLTPSIERVLIGGAPAWPCVCMPRSCVCVRPVRSPVGRVPPSLGAAL